MDCSKIKRQRNTDNGFGTVRERGRRAKKVRKQYKNLSLFPHLAIGRPLDFHPHISTSVCVTYEILVNRITVVDRTSRGASPI